MAELDKNMIEIEIDGNKIKASTGEMLIAVADREGIKVPRFCYHKKLSVAANCRMCLVDVEGAPKPQPACSTPIAEGMKVQTQNQKAKDSQKAVMEFLLINHPLDCPICDQGGECELQDVAMEYGASVSRFNEGKRIVADGDLGALIQTDMTRCIHCTRCVRFGVEVAGLMEMGGTGRGEDLRIEPFLEQGINSELSGNMIDVCPVGALTSKPFRYELRSWQMDAVANVARHDLVGSNIYTQTYKGRVKRVVARENEQINETWISDRDRFSYEGLSHQNRLLTPQIKVAGQWQEVEWQVALDFVVRGLESYIFNNHQANKLAALSTNTATLEEFYLLQKLTREIGSENLDYRLNISDLDQSISLSSTLKLPDLEQQNYVLIVGSNPRLEQPMLNHRLRKATLAGGKIAVINVMTFDFNYCLSQENIIAPNQIAAMLAGVLKAVLQDQGEAIFDYLQDVKISAEAQKIATEITSAKKSTLILGEHIINNKDAANIANLINEIADKTDSSTLNLTETANSMAANLVGFTPTESGLDANAMLEADLKAYILLDIYPYFDFHDPAKAVAKLSDEGSFVIALNSFKDDAVAQYADVLLPIASFFETPGSNVNFTGEVQFFEEAVASPKNAKPAWKVLKVLADLLKLSGFDWTNCRQISAEATSQNNSKIITKNRDIDLKNKRNIEVIWQKSAYATDVLLRHSPSLQATKIGAQNHAFMNATTAKKLQLKADDEYLGVKVVVGDFVANNCVFVQSNMPKPEPQPDGEKD